MQEDVKQLKFAVLFGGSIPLIIYPALMVIMGRYNNPNFSHKYKVMGNNVILSLIIIFGVTIICIEIIAHFIDISKLLLL